MSGKKEGGPQGVPLWAVDGLIDLADDARDLAQAVECAQVASRTSITDPMDFMRGTLSVLLAASERMARKTAKLRRDAEEAMA